MQKDFTVLQIYHVTINTRCPTAFSVPKYYLQHTASEYIYAYYVQVPQDNNFVQIT